MQMDYRQKQYIYEISLPDGVAATPRKGHRWAGRFTPIAFNSWMDEMKPSDQFNCPIL
jgi:hypothetical protein